MSFPTLERYIDIHTHNETTTPSSMVVLNMYEGFETAGTSVACSVGLHPWYLQSHASDFIELQKVASLPNVLAIGECGLDKVCDTDWNLQLSVFAQHIILASALRKPLIIHCVRAYDEVIQLLEKYKVSVPVIFHGFNKKQTIADKLIARGYYLSFGASLLQSNAQVADVFRSIPEDSFFLETDNSGNAITEIYQNAAEIRNTSADTIILQVQQNFKNVFKK
jgi:TatD DNase family protein